VKTVLFVGAGRFQLRAIEHARERGLRVVAVDGDRKAPGLAAADVAETVDFSDVAAVMQVARHHEVDGVLTMSSDRAVPVVAAVAEGLGLPGIGRETAHLLTHKVAMRRRLSDAGVPQPRFAAVRTLAEARTASETVGFPAVLKPADSSGQRGLFLLESDDELERHLHAALAESHSEEAILESFHAGLEVNTMLVARDGHVTLLTASDRRRPAGRGFGVALAHVFPSTVAGRPLEELEEAAIETVHALGLRDGIAYPQLLVSEDGVRLIEAAARIPGGQMDQLVKLGVGVDLLDIALKQALGEPVENELVRPRYVKPLAIHFLTAEPGPLPTGTVRRIGSLEKVRAFPGVVDVDTYLSVSETINPVRLDGDRRGYVIATGDTNLEALDRAEAAARLLDVEVW
jgi:biotin carboxylase